jgi:hypothetical protein
MSLIPTLDFRPKLADTLAGGYTRERFMRDLGAGLTVGVVALPLAMAFAIASGLKPEAGLFTAIIAGFIISALGGSRVQIGGPAGAFIVIVYGIVERYGLANLIIATAMSGVLLFIMGLFKLGTLIRFIPIAVVIGFTNGIAVLIALSQCKDFLGLQVGAMPADFFGITGRGGQQPAHHQPGGAGPGQWLAGRDHVRGSALRPGWARACSSQASSPACPAPSSRWFWPRWPWWCWTSRWTPSAAVLAAFRPRCHRSPGLHSAGIRRDSSWCPPSRWRCWARSSRCCARAWPTT